MTNSNPFLPRIFSKSFIYLISSLLFWQLSTQGILAATAEQLDNNSKLHPFKLTILHTNDLHAHDEAFLEKGHVIGGFPRIAYLINAISKRTPNVLVIDAGDIFQGTPYFSVYHGQIEIEMLNRAHYDLYTIGNHEFDDGAKNLADQLRAAKFEILSSNLDASALPELDKLVKPSTVKTIGNQKIGFIGAITPSLTNLSLLLQPVKLKAQGAEWYIPIANEAKKLKASGVNKIVLISHCGVEYDRELAQNIEEIDAIVGGHSHTRLERPIIVKHKDGSQCLIVQTGCYGRSLGKLDLAFDNKGEIIVPASNYHLINITDHMKEDSDLKAYLVEKAKPFSSLRKNVVGIALGDFDNQFRFYPGDSPLGNLICDAILEESTGHGATIALQNRGGIRGRIDRGLITQEKIQEVLPFKNHLMIATVNGATLKKALEHSVDGLRGGRFLDIRGLKFSYSSKLPIGQRIISAMTADKDGSWDNLEDNKDYRIAINEFSFKGGEGYDFTGAKDIIDTKRTMSQVLSSYLIKQQKVRPAKQGRITFVKE